jgi:5-methyltetrahydrofolate--homocysteine methyltransferase
LADFFTELARRVLIYDGAMGTTLHRHSLTVEDFRVKEGCNEILTVTRPDVVKSVHTAYFEAGSDIVETNTFGASSIVLAEYDLAS